MKIYALPCLIFVLLSLSACGPKEGAPDGGEIKGDAAIVQSNANLSATKTSASAKTPCAARAYDTIGGPIDLIDQTGRRVTEATFKGKPTMIYFGFTYCPDICPSTLVMLSNAYKRLPTGIEPPQTVLISVDPERDTPQALARYAATPVFPKGLVALTGSVAQVRAAATAFGADFSKIATPDSLGEYTMDHTSILYLMDENWKLKTFFAEAEAGPQDIATCLAQHLGKS